MEIKVSLIPPQPSSKGTSSSSTSKPILPPQSKSIFSKIPNSLPCTIHLNGCVPNFYGYFKPEPLTPHPNDKEEAEKEKGARSSKQADPIPNAKDADDRTPSSKKRKEKEPSRDSVEKKDEQKYYQVSFRGRQLFGEKRDLPDDAKMYVFVEEEEAQKEGQVDPEQLLEAYDSGEYEAIDAENGNRDEDDKEKPKKKAKKKTQRVWSCEHRFGRAQNKNVHDQKNEEEDDDDGSSSGSGGGYYFHWYWDQDPRLESAVDPSILDWFSIADQIHKPIKRPCSNNKTTINNKQ